MVWGQLDWSAYNLKTVLVVHNYFCSYIVVLVLVKYCLVAGKVHFSVEVYPSLESLCYW